MLHNIPEFDLYHVAYLKGDPAKEPIATSYSAPGVLAEQTQDRKSESGVGDSGKSMKSAPDRRQMNKEGLEPFTLPFFGRNTHLQSASDRNA